MGRGPFSRDFFSQGHSFAARPIYAAYWERPSGESGRAKLMASLEIFARVIRKKKVAPAMGDRIC